MNMTRKIKNQILLLFILGSAASLRGQDTLVISKDEMLGKLSKNNWQIKIAKKTQDASRADYRQSNALFLPKVELSYSAITTTNPLMAFGSKLNQEILTQQDFNLTLLNDPERTNNFSTQIQVQQPLLNIDGLYERKAAKAKMQAMSLQTQRTEEGVRLELNKSYMTLQLAYHTTEVLDRAVAAAESSLKMVSDYYNQGLLQKPDLLAVQVRVNEIKNQQQAAQNQVNEASDYLAFLINDTTQNQIYLPSEELADVITPLLIAPEMSANRSDILAMNKATEAYRQLAKSSKTKFLPRINAFGSYQLYDDEIFQADADGYLVGAQLSWKIFDGYQAIGKAEKNKINYEKARAEASQYTAKSELEVKNYHRKLSLIKSKIDNNELAVEQAREAYRIRKDRFSQGLEKTNDLMMAESLLLQKELEHLMSIFEYTLTQEYLSFLTK